jgi:hypothetical protein
MISTCSRRARSQGHPCAAAMSGVNAVKIKDSRRINETRLQQLLGSSYQRKIASLVTSFQTRLQPSCEEDDLCAGRLPKEPLYSAFCLARILLDCLPFVPSKERLHRAMALVESFLYAWNYLDAWNYPRDRPSSKGTTPPEVASPCADADARHSRDVTVGLGCALVAATENSLHQLGLPDPSAGQEIDQRATVHASDPGQTLGAPVSSRRSHCTVDMNPVARTGFAAPCASAEATVSVPESGSGGVGSEPGQSHAGREASGVDERTSRHRHATCYSTCVEDHIAGWGES